MNHELRKKLKKVRRDLSDRVWHFTNRAGEPDETLKAIIDSRKVKGNTDKFCPVASACFTEAPLSAAMDQSDVLDELGYTRLSDYGIGFTKEWLFEKGGRPVIYNPTRETENWPDDLKWRHCAMDLATGLDFTWQREWRAPGDVEFDLDDDIMIVAPTYDDGMGLLVSGGEIDHDRDEIYLDIDLPFVCFETLRKASEPVDVEIHTFQ